MKKLSLLTTLLLVGAFATSCIITSDSHGDSSLSVVNESDYTLFELRIAESFDVAYGPNLLLGTSLPPDFSVDVILDCGTYDVLVVDDVGTECELRDLSVCFDDAVWIIDNRTLDFCSF